MSQHDHSKMKKVSRPSSLKTRLNVFLGGKGSKEPDRSAARRRSRLTLEPWQFFVLEVLPDCEDFSELATVFEERFDRPLAVAEADDLFAQVVKYQLLSADHPIIAAFRRKQDVSVGGVSGAGQQSSRAVDDKKGAEASETPLPLGVSEIPKLPRVSELPKLPRVNEAPKPLRVSETPKPPRASEAPRTHRVSETPEPPRASEAPKTHRVSEAPEPPRASEAPKTHRVSEAPQPPRVGEAPKPLRAGEATLPPGVSEVVGMDDSRGHTIGMRLDPKGPLRILHALLRPLRRANYLLPLILVTSFFVLSGSAESIVEDLGRPGLAKFIVLAMVVVSALLSGLTALVAYGFHATVKGYCIYTGMLPSFTVRIDDAEKLSRRERIWLHAAPLLMRMGLFGIGLLLWFNTRSVDGIWAPFGLAVAAISAISFLLAANPLIRSSAYHLISAYLEEPCMRQRSRQVLLGKLRGGTYAQVDGDVLVAYSLASAAYGVVLVGILLLVLGRIFNFHVGTFIFLLLAVVGAPVTWNMIGKFKEIGRSHGRKAQFQRWRKGDLPKGEAESDEKVRLSPMANYSLRSSALLLMVVLFLPYGHEIGGRFVVLPQGKQDVTSEVSGIIETINFDGGEFLRQGTVIGNLSCTEYLAQVKILTAKIAEQEAVIADLRSRPRPEEVDVAERNLQTEETRVRFSKEELARMEKMYAEKTVSFEDLEDARREHELDVTRVKEKRATLDLVKAGAPPDQIAAAEAKLQSWEEERQLYREKIEKSVFYAPLDGTLVAMHLKQKIGSYFERGQPLAVVENTEQVFVQIDVAEEDIGFVQEKARVRVRFPTYSGEDIEGSVMMIGPTVTEASAGRVLQITAQIDNADGKLKSGMEGYAKIRGESLPVWRVLSMGILRFFNVEAWSWLP